MAMGSPGDYTLSERRELKVMERAFTTYWEPPTVRHPFWKAEDPETGCVGVAEDEDEARANLVRAVRAYQAAEAPSVGYYSAGRGQTVRMHWKEDGPVTRAVKGLLKRLR